MSKFANWTNDPAYRFELEKLDGMVAEYQQAREAGDDLRVQFVCGMMLGQHAAIYKLSPPAGLIDVPAIFRRDAGGQP